MSERLGPIYAKQDYAGFFRRTLALAIDAAILIVGSFSALIVLVVVGREQWLNEASGFWIVPALLVGWFVYFVGFRLTPLGPPGYRIVGIRYVSMFCELPGVSSLLYRSLLVLTFAGYFVFAHVWMFFDKRKQAWYDKVSGLYVVKRKARPAEIGTVAEWLVDFMGLTFRVWEPGKGEMEDSRIQGFEGSMIRGVEEDLRVRRGEGAELKRGG